MILINGGNTMDTTKYLENLVNAPMMEYEDLLTNIDFMTIIDNNNINSKMPLSMIFCDYKVHLYGNLEVIHIFDNNLMKLIIHYRPDPASSDCRAVVRVCDKEIQQTIRRYVNTATGIKMTCKFDNSGIPSFLDCVELEEYNLPLKIPYSICSECGTIYINGGKTDFCEICGSGKMYKVDDFYKFTTEHNLKHITFAPMM